MDKKIVMIDESETIKDAVKKMVETEATCLIVDRKGSDDAYGIVTRRDIVNKVIAKALDPEKLTIRDIMNKPLVTVTGNLGIQYVAGLMAKSGYRRLPVFDGNYILGIISNPEIFNSYAKHLSKK